MLAQLRFSILFSIISVLSFAQSYPQGYFKAPMDIPLILSGTYGELRGNHFHAGLDIKTNGVVGQAIRAAAEGEVVRIAVSPYGYGNALYVRHPNGYTTVYAHLQGFTQHIADWVETQQYNQESFSVNLFPPSGKFRVAQGDIIALSGNSGGSGGPHLHFEIRDSRTEEPLNPLLFGFDIPDHRAPEIKGVYAYPLTAESHLNQRDTRTSLSFQTISNNEFKLKWPQRGEGEIGFAIEVIDRLDGAWNSNGPYRIVQYVNDAPVSEFVMERFAFSEKRYINAHMDYDLYTCCNDKVNRMWVLPGNNLRAYRQMKNSGIITVEAGKSYDLKWEVYDVAGNVTTLTGTINGEARNTPLAPTPPGVLFACDQPNFGSVGDMTYRIPANIFYQDLYVVEETHESKSFCYGPIYQLGVQGMAVHNHFDVQLPLEAVPEKYHAQTVVVSLDDNNTHPDSWDGTLTNGKLGTSINARVRTMGRFTLMVDSVAPNLRVRRGITNGSTLRAGSEISLTITDDLSGIADYECRIDGNWHLMSYDAKNNALKVELRNDITPGNHEMIFKAVDDRGNTSTLTYSFIFQN